MVVVDGGSVDSRRKFQHGAGKSCECSDLIETRSAENGNNSATAVRSRRKRLFKLDLR